MFAFVACGSTDSTVTTPASTTDAETSTTTTTGEPVGTGADDSDPLDVEFSSDPIEAGPIFGSSAAVAVDDEVFDSCPPDGEEACTDVDDDPVVATCSNDGVEACNDLVDDERPLFEPAPVDRPFCSLLDDLDGRPFPSDAVEAVSVIRVWIGELRKVATETVRADLDLLIRALDDAIADGSGLEVLDANEELDGANERIETHVESACEGTGAPVPDDDRPPTFDDPPLPGGLVIPVIEFADASDTGRRIFGERDRSRFDDSFVPAESDMGFCTALEIVAGRPTPSADLDEIRFVDGYVRAIQPLVPVEISDQIDLVLEWTGRIVEAGEFTEQDDDRAEEFLGEAVETIDSFVDARCNGL